MAREGRYTLSRSAGAAVHAGKRNVDRGVLDRGACALDGVFTGVTGGPAAAVPCVRRSAVRRSAPRASVHAGGHSSCANGEPSLLSVPSCPALRRSFASFAFRKSVPDET
jgi:hypothetical protein